MYKIRILLNYLLIFDVVANPYTGTPSVFISFLVLILLKKQRPLQKTAYFVTFWKKEDFSTRQGRATSIHDLINQLLRCRRKYFIFHAPQVVLQAANRPYTLFVNEKKSPPGYLHPPPKDLQPLWKKMGAGRSQPWEKGRVFPLR